MHIYRDKRFWILLLLATFCGSALIISQLLNDPARRVRSAGAAYSPNLKSGKWIRPKEGTHFDDRQLAIIIDCIRDFREPHALTLTGDKLTDDGVSAFVDASNIYSVGLVGLNVSDVALTYLNRMEGLRYVAILDCPNISDTAVKSFREANPRVEVVHRSIDDE